MDKSDKNNVFVEQILNGNITNTPFITNNMTPTSLNSSKAKVEETTPVNIDEKECSHLLYDKIEMLQKEFNEVNSKLNLFLTDLNNTNGHVKLNRVNNTTQSSNQPFSNISPLVSSPSLVNMTTKMYSYKKGSNELPDRIYLKRNSLLTEMFKISHIRTIRHIFISIMIVLALQVIFNDLLEKQTIEFDLIRWCFGQFDTVFYTWFYMKMATSCLVYYCFHHWSKNRIYYIANKLATLKSTNSNEKQSKFLFFNYYDMFWLILFSVYLLAFIIVPAYIVGSNRLPPGSAFIILLEQLRMLMKTYAFVRSNIPRALANGKIQVEHGYNSNMEVSENKKNLIGKNCINLTNESNNSQDEETDEETKIKSKLCPDFSCYLYFLFAPTLVYQDQYPRTSRIKWYSVFTNFAQVFGAIFYTYYIFLRFCIPVFQHFNTEHVTIKMFIHSILNCTLPGTLLLLVAFFSFLHCWLNAWAEMLRFADRMFYKDWWNSTNYSNYYRTWNVVVHDWLYAYIYKDAYYILGKEYKIACQFLIFILSAFFHEYVLTMAFGFFYPVLFVMFGAIGFLCMFLKSENNTNFWNFFTWIGLEIGLGGLMCLYSIEFYARQNCSQSIESSILDYLLPRSFTCGTQLGLSNRVEKIDL